LLPLILVSIQAQAGQLPGDAQGLLQRDRRVAFTSRTEELALATLGEADTDVQRAAALLALGAAGAGSQRSRLISWASDGSSAERQAAILGLGELVAGGAPSSSIAMLLEGWTGEADLGVAECAGLACLRSGVENSRAHVVMLAATPDHALSSRAAALLAFPDTDTSAVPFATARLFDLRWDAARRFGTIDGRSWSATQRLELTQDRSFMRAIILLSASDLSFAGVRDHLLEALTEVGDVAAVRAAVRAMPREVDQLVGAELWLPESPEMWRVLVQEAIHEGVAALMPRSFERAVQLSETAALAGGVLARSDARYTQVLPSALQHPDPQFRILGALGVADGSVEALVAELLDLERDPDVDVRAAGLVARIQVGDPRAREIGRSVLGRTGEASEEERTALVGRLARSHRFPRIVAFNLEVLHLTEGRDWALLAASAKLHGRTVDTALLVSLFSELAARSFERPLVIRALSRFPSEADRAFLAGIFPIEDDRDANLELAVGLLRSGHAEALPLLQAAVWSGDWNESVLAAAIVKHSSGMRLLEHWVSKPPPYASAADIRRLGFAIGEWGGMDAFQSLTRSVGGGAERPALQGALLGALVSRTH
jgi:hypothetical protein